MNPLRRCHLSPAAGLLLLLIAAGKTDGAFNRVIFPAAKEEVVLKKQRPNDDKEGTYQDIVSAPDVWNQIMVELGLSLNVLSFKPA